MEPADTDRIPGMPCSANATQSARASANVIAWPLGGIPHAPLGMASILVVGDDASAVGRIVVALEGAGADVSLCRHPLDAAHTVADDMGVWDAAIVAGGADGYSAQAVLDMLRDADPGLPVALSSHTEVANVATVPERDPRATVAAIRALIGGTPCAS